MWDVLRFRGQEWQVVGQSGDQVTLRSLGGDELQTVRQADLLHAPDYVLITPTLLPNLDRVALISQLPADVRRRLLALEQHLNQIRAAESETGHPARSVVAAKAVELAAAGELVSEGTLWRYLAAYRAAGVAGLVDDRQTRSGSITGRVDARLVAIIAEELASKTKRPTGTRSRAIQAITARAAADGVPVPSQATPYRVLANLGRQRHAFGNATTRRTQANRPGRAYSSRRSGRVSW